jgi:hypothetical protein
VQQPSPRDAPFSPHLIVAEVVGAVRDGRHDLAIAKLVARTWSNEVLGSTVRLKGAREPEVGDVLEKVGGGTGRTHAVVEYVGNVSTVYARNCRGFVLRPATEGPAEISLPGDSGAVWYDPRTGAAVGLHLEGELSGKEQAIASCMTDALKLFNATL